MARTRVVGLLAILLTACSEKPQPVAVDFPAADSAGAALLVARCGLCHVAPHPAVHVADAWSAVINRMQMRMRSRGYPVLVDEEQRVLLDYLQTHAASAVK